MFLLWKQCSLVFQWLVTSFFTSWSNLNRNSSFRYTRTSLLIIIGFFIQLIIYYYATQIHPHGRLYCIPGFSFCDLGIRERFLFDMVSLTSFYVLHGLLLLRFCVGIRYSICSPYFEHARTNLIFLPQQYWWYQSQYPYYSGYLISHPAS